MIISKNSWHYRLLSFFDMKIPTSLCPYFWKSVFAHGVVAVVLTMVSACLFFLFFLTGMIQLYPNIPDGLNPFTLLAVLSWTEIGQIILYSLKNDLYIIMSVISILYVLFAGTRRFFHGLIYDSALFAKIRKHDDYDDYRRFKDKKRRESKDYKEAHPSVIKEYLKARKSKICPMLEFK